MSVFRKVVSSIFGTGLFMFAVIGTIASDIPILKTEEKEEIIRYSTSVIYDDDMREGTSKTKQEGKNGKKTVVYSVSYKHDKEVDRKKESETIIEPAIDEIIVKGTKKYYMCSNGVEYDSLDDKNECETRIKWEEQKQASLQECYADSGKFDCWYDEYPGTTLHWSYWVYDYGPSTNNYAPNTSNYRSGAVCRDGWQSSATGRGACSHHGGVLYWF